MTEQIAAPKKDNDSLGESGSLVWRNLLSWPAIILLLLAAALKAHQLSTSPYVENLILESKLVTSVLIIFEILLAVWLISNFRSEVARLVAMTTFCVFCIIACIKVLAGETSCGCFGVIEIPPTVTVFVDLATMVLLFFWSPIRSTNRPNWILIAAAIICSAAVQYPILTFTTSSLTDVGQVVGDGKLVIIETSAWTGKRLPLAGFINGQPDYMAGQWTMVLYHEDCPVCQRLIRAASGEISDSRTVFVEVPPFQSPPRQDRDDLIWRKLSEKHEWFVTAPDAIELVDGKVVRVLGQLK